MSDEIFRRIQSDFLGTSAQVPVVQGRAPRTYLDSTATALMPRSVHAVVTAYLEKCCANSHTNASLSGRETTRAIEATRELVRRFFGATNDHEVIFIGNGATGALNRLSGAILPDKDRPLVVTTEMEHHSNILPWVRSVGLENVRFVRIDDNGALDMDHLHEILVAEGRLVRLVSVTAVSNVTGVINPIYQIANRAHDVGAEICVDAAQAAPHIALRMADLDYLAFSGHKLYAPGSPGVLIAKRSAFPSSRVVGDVGGGAVQYVGADGIRWADRACHREEAGTPNIPGIITLGAAITLLNVIQMETMMHHEELLSKHALDCLLRTEGVVVYGPAGKRAGVISFNIGDTPHGLVASVLSDYFGIAVRNECFCAQPYVRRQIAIKCQQTGNMGPCMVGPGARGMVRASFGMFNTEADVNRLCTAVQWIQAHATALAGQYEQHGAEYVHKTFRPQEVFDIGRELSRDLLERVVRA